MPYSFSTKYCSFLCPEVFAIYDSSVEAFFKIESIKRKFNSNSSFSVTGKTMNEVRKSRGYINLLTAMNLLISDEDVFSHFDGPCSIKTLDMFIWKKWKNEHNNEAPYCSKIINEYEPD